MSNSSIRALFYAGSKTVAATGTPEALAANPLLVDSLRIEAIGTNTGTVTLGFLDDPSETVKYVVGVPFVTTATAGKKIDLSLITVKVTANGDGVTYIALN